MRVFQTYLVCIRPPSTISHSRWAHAADIWECNWLYKDLMQGKHTLVKICEWHYQIRLGATGTWESHEKSCDIPFSRVGPQPSNTSENATGSDKPRTLSTQRWETPCRQENSTEITSRKRSDCKLQELCNNCERTRGVTREGHEGRAHPLKISTSVFRGSVER